VEQAKTESSSSRSTDSLRGRGTTFRRPSLSCCQSLQSLPALGRFSSRPLPLASRAAGVVVGVGEGLMARGEAG